MYNGCIWESSLGKVKIIVKWICYWSDMAVKVAISKLLEIEYYEGNIDFSPYLGLLKIPMTSILHPTSMFLSNP